MTGDLCNLVFGQIIHWIISVLLSKIKTEVLVLGERKLGVKRNSRVSKEVGLLGAWGFFLLCFFPPLIHVSVMLYCPASYMVISAHLRGSKLRCQCRYREEMGIHSSKVCFATGENLLCSCPLCVFSVSPLCVF